ncbi:DHBP synthase RibB-like alpha/beta domain-containing protein [Perilla frutescens var. frutescens]|nr:DHBP synthase RibB-like alpha/beta domain-containing protein [Perilla frutescens var. frutescens]
METHQFLLSYVKKGSKKSQLLRISTSLLDNWRIEYVQPPAVEIEYPDEFDEHSDGLEFVNPNQHVCDGNPCVVAFCKGLLCLKYRNGMHVLWNPSTNSYKLLHLYGLKPLPCPLSRHTKRSLPRHTEGCIMSTISVAWGLGFVDETQDYKFVKLLNNYYDDDNADQSCHGESERVELYSFADNSWKEIPYDTTYYITECGTYANGFCYWDGDGGIVSFDFAREEFSILPYPDPNMRGYLYKEYHVCLTVLDGCLYAVIYPETNRETETHSESESHFKFWVMKEDRGWSRTTEYDILVNADAPLGFCRDGNYLLLQGKNGALLIYNYSARTLTTVEEICGYLLSMSVIPYVESTVQFSALKPTECIETTLKRKSGLKKRINRRGTLKRMTGSMEAVHRIYEIKGRKHTSPLAICVGDVQDIQRFATTDHLPLGLLDSLLPGPVTVVLRRGDSSILEKSLNPGLDSIGVRVPDCDFIRLISRGSQSALALTSANLSGQPSSVDVKEFENLWQHCARIYNGGVLPSRQSSILLSQESTRF